MGKFKPVLQLYIQVTTHRVGRGDENMAKKYKQIFTVTGELQFPIDMLRYDCCYPETQEDVSKIHCSLERPSIKAITISLTRWVETKGRDLPTADRWRSFGWKVNEKDIRIY
jgi:hypothetical protein